MTKDHVIKIPKTQIVMAFVATCIETTARFLNVSYKEIFTRMKKVGMIENYIFKNYDILHTQSREYIADDFVAEKTFNIYSMH